MSGKVYSERMLTTGAVNTWISWECPPSKRAVLKTIMVPNANANDASVGLYLAGVPLLNVMVPARSLLIYSGIHVCIYENEALQGSVSHEGASIVTSGYLFDDTEGRTSPPPAQSAGAPQPPDWTAVT